MELQGRAPTDEEEEEDAGLTGAETPFFWRQFPLDSRVPLSRQARDKRQETGTKMAFRRPRAAEGEPA